MASTLSRRSYWLGIGTIRSCLDILTSTHDPTPTHIHFDPMAFKARNLFCSRVRWLYYISEGQTHRGGVFRVQRLQSKITSRSIRIAVVCPPPFRSWTINMSSGSKTRRTLISMQRLLLISCPPSIAPLLCTANPMIMILRIFGRAKSAAYNPQFISNPSCRNQLGLESLPLHPAPPACACSGFSP